jgi:hypothetical protein
MTKKTTKKSAPKAAKVKKGAVLTLKVNGEERVYEGETVREAVAGIIDLLGAPIYTVAEVHTEFEGKTADRIIPIRLLRGMAAHEVNRNIMAQMITDSLR